MRVTSFGVLATYWNHLDKTLERNSYEPLLGIHPCLNLNISLSHFPKEWVGWG